MSAPTTDGGAAPGIDPPPPRITEAVIPEPRGDCPEFVSGTFTLLGRNVDVLAAPPGTTPGPMLIAWHPTGATGRAALDMLPDQVKLEIAQSGGLVLAPNAEGGTPSGEPVTPGSELWFTGDFELVDELVACAVEHHDIDPRRIYTTGCTFGGLMAGALTIARSSYIAAAAIHWGGLVSNDAFFLQDPARVPSVISFYSLNEQVFVSFEQTSRFLTDAIAVAGGFAAECRLDVRMCGAPPELQVQAWEFLKAHPFGVSPFPYADGLPEGFPESCMTFPEPPEAGPICAGTHAPCAELASNEPSVCTHHGCTWQAGACSGTPHACADVAREVCGTSHRGCALP